MNISESKMTMFFGPSDDDLIISVQFIILKYVQKRVVSFLLRVSR